jgi:FdhE protein
VLSSLRVPHESNMQQRLLTPEEIAAQAGATIPYLRLPDRSSVFADRAARLHTLAAGHAMGGYLEFIALVADEQQKLLDGMPPVRLPSQDWIEQCNEHAMPPLNSRTHQRDPQWCNALRHMLRALADRTEGKTRDVAARLERARDELYEAQASKLLAGLTFGLDVAAAPLIGAGLQVYFTHMAGALGQRAFPRLDVATICPCCGSRPTASVTRLGKDSGYRFLHCSLCNAEWHMVRIKCSNCESTKGISYQVIDDGRSPEQKAVKAEVCDECGSYLKICYMDRDPQVEPIADDLATLSLDLLVSDAGKTPSGVNLMLIHGDPESL